MSSRVPPASPRPRGWQPPAIGSEHTWTIDQSIWRVYQLDRANRMVCLTPRIGNTNMRRWVPAGDFKREYRSADQ